MPFAGLMIDVQGTLIDDIDRKPIRGSIEMISWLEKKNFPYVIVTNNTKYESTNFSSFLHSLGFGFSEGKYLDPLMVLDAVLPPCSVAAYGSNAFLLLLQQRGYKIDFNDPKAVLIGVKPDFTNDEYATMIELVLGGAKLIGMHETSIYAKDNRRYPGVGAILKMISFATGCDYEVVGKPSKSFFDNALALLKAQNQDISYFDTMMISDDMIGDLIGAAKMGMHTALVLSGKIRSTEEIYPFVSSRPEWVENDVKACFDRFKKAMK